MRRSAFSLVELVIACALILFGLLVFFSVFSSNSKHSTQSRNRTVAHLLATNLIEEVEAHSYGAPQPRSWSDETELPAELWIQGKPQQLKFQKKVEFENGSFVGQTADNSDLVRITISWREGVGGDQDVGTTAAGSDDNKELKVEIPVWR